LLSLIQALADRHQRIKGLAYLSLPPSVISKLGLAPSGLQEQRAPSIIEMLISHGIDVPPALELDGKGLYDCYTFIGHQIGMNPDIADALLSAGFRDIDQSNDDGWSPLLQSWYHHNFEMVDWFASRGVKLDSRHTDIPLTALHLCVKGISLHGPGSTKEDGNMSHLRERYIEMTQKELGIPYDDCTCECSSKGCTPVKSLLENPNHWPHLSQKDEIRTCVELLKPPRLILKQYIHHFTRTVLFDFMGGDHTCCTVGPRFGLVDTMQRPKRAGKWQKRLHACNGFPGEHYQCCRNGLPVPRRASLQALQDPDVLRATLDFAMSHYDEMNRPDTMPAEEQVYAYINWILEEGYLDIDVSDGCGYCTSDYWRKNIWTST